MNELKSTSINESIQAEDDLPDLLANETRQRALIEDADKAEKNIPRQSRPWILSESARLRAMIEMQQQVLSSTIRRDRVKQLLSQPVVVPQIDQTLQMYGDHDPRYPFGKEFKDYNPIKDKADRLILANFVPFDKMHPTDEAKAYKKMCCYALMYSLRDLGDPEERENVLDWVDGSYQAALPFTKMVSVAFGDEIDPENLRILIRSNPELIAERLSKFMPTDFEGRVMDIEMERTVNSIDDYVDSDAQQVSNMYFNPTAEEFKRMMIEEGLNPSIYEENNNQMILV